MYFFEKRLYYFTLMDFKTNKQLCMINLNVVKYFKLNTSLK